MIEDNETEDEYFGRTATPEMIEAWPELFTPDISPYTTNADPGDEDD